MIKDNKLPLKEKFLEYFRQLPVQKLASKHIGKDEDTICRWKKQDSDFADLIDQALAEFALKNINKVKSKEWLLERLFPDHFGQREAPKTLIQVNYQPIFSGESLHGLPASDSDAQNIPVKKEN